MPGSEDPPIIVSGGSVTVDFDRTLLPQRADGTHHHADKRIKRIEITGDVDITGDANSGFSGSTDSGRVTVKIYFGNADADEKSK
ncbi:MAG TPA: hypothetical protein VGP08_02625 [Pyrinomonadaceae bacterium]|jgi:hypothetical protein|nr:hypothetical protein [Pyrinomonadaceae bacterium]